MIENCKKFLVKGKITLSKSINLHTVESTIARDLGLIQKKFKSSVDIGSYPFFRLSVIGVSIVIRSSNKMKLINCDKNIRSMIKIKKIKVFKN